MNKIVTFALGVFAGASAGYLVAYQKATKEFDERWDKEHEATHGAMVDPSKENETTTPDEVIKPEDSVAVAIRQSNAVEAPRTDDVSIISEDQYGEYDDFKEVVLHYFSDGVFADYDAQKTVVPDYLGSVTKQYFDDNDSEEELYIRDESRKTDYQILQMNQDYEEFCRARERYKRKAARYQ